MMIRLKILLFFIPLINYARSDTSPNPNPYFVTSGYGVIQGPIYLKGSVKSSWEEDEEGFTVTPSGNSTYYYAKQNVTSGDLVATTLPIRKKVKGVLVGSSPLRLGIARHEQPSEKVKRKKCGDFCDNSKGHGRELRNKRNLVSTTGTLKNLIVLFKFADHTTRSLPSVSDIDILMNHPGDGVNTAYNSSAPTGSVREHYLKSSYGQLQIDSFVTNWVTIDYTEAYCSGGSRGLTTIIHTCLRNALSKVDSQVDFTQFDVDGDKWIDAIGFLHSGYGAEWGGNDAYNTNYLNRIWSHKWAIYTQIWTSAEGVSVYNYHISPSVWGTSGSSIGRIGVIAHETGHYLGLPDLYDSDNDGSGIGSWSLMANSWGFNGNQYYPPPMDAWCKMTLGWITPTVISPSNVPYVLGPQCQSNTIFKITANFPAGEYLLMENRQKVCLYDSQMGGSYSGGLAIFHIDENQPSYNAQGYPGQSGWPDNGNHYKVALLQADALYELEKNMNRGNYGDIFHDGGTLGPSTSSGPYPNSDSYAYGQGIKKTGITISSIASSGNNMSFILSVDLASTKPTNKPSLKPISKPTSKPTPRKPTRKPSRAPSRRPSRKPTKRPTRKPSPRKPTRKPSRAPSRRPSRKPTKKPTAKPAPRAPTRKPTRKPSVRPSKNPSRTPTRKPSLKPSPIPTFHPSARPSSKPTVSPSAIPSAQPSMTPSISPSAIASSKPTSSPTVSPSAIPSAQPSATPSISSSSIASSKPTSSPTVSPSAIPSAQPSTTPSISPSAIASSKPTSSPTVSTTAQPTEAPTV